MRAQPTEWIIASDETIVISIESEVFVEVLRNVESFGKFFYELENIQESYSVCSAAAGSSSVLPAGWDGNLLEFLRQSKIKSLYPGEKFNCSEDNKYTWLLSTSKVSGFDQIYKISDGDNMPEDLLCISQVVGM